MIANYLIIGNGNMARHMSHYFSLLGIKYDQYHYSEPQNTLIDKLDNATHVLVLIKDDVIDEYIEKNLLIKCTDKILINFSGSLISKYSYSVHPLMTFSGDLYDLDTYKSIPFICELGMPKLYQLLPGIPNSDYYIDAQKKSYYHALCSIANNFTTILFQAVSQRLVNEINLDFNVLNPIMNQTIKNIQDNINNALTGPLKRNDTITINKHLESLNNDRILDLYQEFVNFYNKENLIK